MTFYSVLTTLFVLIANVSQGYAETCSDKAVGNDNSNQWMRASSSTVSCTWGGFSSPNLFQINIYPQALNAQPPSLVADQNLPNGPETMAANCNFALTASAQSVGSAKNNVYINLQTGEVKVENGLFRQVKPVDGALLDPSSVGCDFYTDGFTANEGESTIFVTKYPDNLRLVDLCFANRAKNKTVESVRGLQKRCNAALIQALEFQDKVVVTSSGLVTPASGFFVEASGNK